MKRRNTHQSYLSRIRFDPKLLSGAVASYIGNIRIVLLLAFSIAVLGLVSYFNLPQRLNPEINIPIVTVVTVLPGANPNDVENLVTIPLEDKLRGVAGLDTIASVSQENVSVISMQFYSTVTADKARADAKETVDAVNALPPEAQEPKVAAIDFENQPVWQFALVTSADPVSLAAYSRTLEDAIEEQTGVDRVEVRGRETQVIAVDMDPVKVSQYGINPLLLSSTVKSLVTSYPAGTVETGRNSYSLKIDGLVSSVEDVRNILMDINGKPVRLGEIAVVHERSRGSEAGSFIADAETPSRRVITFSVYKRSTADIVQTADLVRQTVTDMVGQTQGRFAVRSITNAGEAIREQFGDLLIEFRSTILLVFLTLLLFLGLRQALISSITVPLTFLSAFVIMRFIGMSVNFLSLFAFLLSLGLLIDDTIVVVAAMTTYYKTGKFSPYQTGLLVWRDTIVPIWSTTVTTIWSFVPLLLSTGIIGEFIKPIPLVVTATMVSSTAIAVLITLPLMIILLKPAIPVRVAVLLKIIGIMSLAAFLYLLVRDNRFAPVVVWLYTVVAFLYWRLKSRIHRAVSRSVRGIPFVPAVKRYVGAYASHGVIDINGFAKGYERVITRILRSARARKAVLVVIISYSVLSFLLLPLGLVKNEFFPKTDADVVYVNMELPAGTVLETNVSETQNMLDRFRNVQGVEFVVADTGTRLSTQMASASDQSNTTLFTFHLPDARLRRISSITIADALRELVLSYPGMDLSVVEQSGGPPAGADVQLTLSGTDLALLNTYADEVTGYLSREPGIVNIEKSINPGTSALTFVPDYDSLNRHGIRADNLGLWLRTAASGFTLDSVSFDRESTEKKDVIFSFGMEKQTPESITALSVPTMAGVTIPLSALGHFEMQANPTSITREEGKRTITVSAGVDRSYSITEKNRKLLDFSGTIKLPPGYEWKTGGVNEENQKSVQSVLQAMIVSFLLILVTMVVQFRSYRQAIIVLLVIPLAVSSVFFIFALTGTPLSFPALIGVLSLFGIVVTNSMFIVDKVNLNRREGMPFVEAIADAGGSRLEPIILTKLCTVFGLLPITIADPLWRGLGGAIISGIVFSSSIMLLFIPVVYYYWMRDDVRP